MDGSRDLPDAATLDGSSQDDRLREFNHRVLNSLTMISSMIGMEARALDEGAGRAALERVRSRVVAVSHLYRILGASETDGSIDASRYLGSVAESVAASVGPDDRITVVVRSVSRDLTSAQAAALGLITNEAMTNAYKHAFTTAGHGTITISLTGDADLLTLTIADDGHGMAEDAQKGLGTTLIESLTADLAGELQMTGSRNGSRVTVRFPAGS